MTAIYLAVVLAVLDGDTLKVAIELWPGQVLTTSLRVADIDAPELRGKCPAEIVGAHRAREALTALVQRERVTLTGVGHDKYGRALAHVRTAAGTDVTAAMLEAGLVRAYDGGTRAGWCDTTRRD